MRTRSVRAAALLILLVSCRTPERAAHPAASAKPTDDDRLQALVETGDPFALREALRGVPPDATDWSRYAHAVAAHAFDVPARSLELLAPLLKRDDLPDGMTGPVWRLAFDDAVRLGRYGEAAELSRRLGARARGVAPEVVEDLANDARVMAALADVPPMVVTVRGTSSVSLEEGRAPVTIAGQARRYLVDTGANFSVLMRSEAEALGLEIRRADVTVGSATGVEVIGDVAVAPRLTLGEAVLEHVPFLVLPDEALTFPGLEIRGLVGFPVLEALGSLQVGPEDRLAFPAPVPAGEGGALALVALEPMVRVGVWGDAVACLLDTGANRTGFLARFFEAHAERLEREGHRETARLGGAGGIREVDAWVVPELELEVGGQRVRLEEVPVYPDLGEGTAAHCRIGQDVIGRFAAYRLDFRRMAFALEAPRGEVE